MYIYYSNLITVSYWQGFDVTEMLVLLFELQVAVLSIPAALNSSMGSKNATVILVSTSNIFCKVYLESCCRKIVFSITPVWIYCYSIIYIYCCHNIILLIMGGKFDMFAYWTTSIVYIWFISIIFTFPNTSSLVKEVWKTKPL